MITDIIMRSRTLFIITFAAGGLVVWGVAAAAFGLYRNSVSPVRTGEIIRQAGSDTSAGQSSVEVLGSVATPVIASGSSAANQPTAARQSDDRPASENNAVQADDRRDLADGQQSGEQQSSAKSMSEDKLRRVEASAGATVKELLAASGSKTGAKTGGSKPSASAVAPAGDQIVVRPEPAPARPQVSTPTSGCVVTAKLVNPCRPWLGAWSNTYPGHTNTGLRDMMGYHESRIGRQVEIVHAYSNPGATLSADQRYYATRKGTMLLLNYKPSTNWASASGSNPSVNSQIDAMARSIKAIAPAKIFLTVFHEPENDINHATTSCPLPTAVSNAGSPRDYINMWHNIRARFDALGVNNVVWGINYMMYPGGTCIIKQLWPGNNYVDWIWSDPYIQGSGNRPDFVSRMDFTYNWFRDNSDSTYDFNSKAWGLAEWGFQKGSQSQAYAVYDQARAAVTANRYPNFKAYVVFDSNSGPRGGGAIGLTSGGVFDPIEQQHYNQFANDPVFRGAYSGLW